jgi:myo-inositol-1-phosphate synthase
MRNNKIKIAIVGVGNCASALTQGIHFSKENPDVISGVLGLKDIGGYKLSDIEIVAAFDVNMEKVGKDVADAIFVKPNCAKKLTQVPKISVRVNKGPVMDGVAEEMERHIPISESQNPANVKEVLRESGAEIIVNFLPSGSEEATRFYAEAALESGLGVVNAIPVMVANDKTLREKAEQHNAPIIGDDIKSQIGATIIHRAVGDLFPMRGAILDRTIQLDWGGDMDFANLMSSGRYNQGKRKTKTESVVSRHPNKNKMDVQISAVDYIPFLGNTKEAYFRLEGRIFGNMPVSLHMFMQVEDSYNSAGIVSDAIRCAKIALDRKIGGVLVSPSSFFCKLPIEQYADVEARKAVDEFIDGKRER